MVADARNGLVSLDERLMPQERTNKMHEEKANSEALDHGLDPRRTALLAYEFWRARGCPEGSPEDDWFLAEEQLRHQQIFTMAEAA